MDRRRKLLILAGLLFGFAVSSFAAAQHQLTRGEQRLPRELDWLSPGADLAQALAPGLPECLNPQAPKQAILGRLAFESPALLGGQASRMGLSCAGCHPNARTHPQFMIEGLSSSAGTADVSLGFLSAHADDQTFNPKPIPDLAYPLSIKDRRSAEFTAKLVTLIETEFDGEPAPPAVLDALQRYLVNVDIRFCHSRESEEAELAGANMWQLQGLRINQTVEWIQTAALEEDRDTVEFLVRTARRRLETLYLAYGLANNAELDEELILQSRWLEQLPKMLGRDLPTTNLLEVWLVRNQPLYSMLDASAWKSAFAPDRLVEQRVPGSSEN